ncbi:helix-turn-helix domain-containing protein [Actinoplanes sp. Pm04-4]|uniref:Helix-turn-helix domain-containing protein n=1 Tax=Paractinoplanes pyxinae TaxID=2997416 RepID=A0ABT4BEV3_9ACTN|nr:XRE family transcriptional regulator [Actinoplanes pyxinae]MCY1145007.1 helix-turn-helix domain-containing protein [Actinoplanes pyxinae]
MEIAELGATLRNRRVAAGRTIASVSADAGLSVPYIANLENGRGNPTLAAVSNLAAALGVSLEVRLDGDDGTASSTALPDSLVQFSRSERFRSEAARLPSDAARSRLLEAMAAMGAVATRPMTDLDWHRMLDVHVLTTRDF